MAMTPEQMQELQGLYQELNAVKARMADACRRAARMSVLDYDFKSKDGPVKLSSLFGDKPDLIIVHNMGKSCPYCTLWADGLNGLTDHLRNRAGFALTSPDDVATQTEFAASRAWRFPMLSTQGTTFARDMGFENAGRPMPGFSAFRKQPDGSILRTGASMFGPGDDYCAIWPMMEMLEGGAAGWAPKYQY